MAESESEMNNLNRRERKERKRRERLEAQESRERFLSNTTEAQRQMIAYVSYSEGGESEFVQRNDDGSCVMSLRYHRGFIKDDPDQRQYPPKPPDFSYQVWPDGSTDWQERRHPAARRPTIL
jgi:hypothetical protein